MHEGGVTIQILDDGAFRFIRPDGRAFDSIAPEHTAPLPDWTQLIETHREQGIRIDKSTAVTRWHGESMDYSVAIQALLWRPSAQNISAATPGGGKE